MPILIDEIKDALRRSKTMAEVNAVHSPRHVDGVEKSGNPEDRTKAIQIKNLEAYRRHCIKADQATDADPDGVVVWRASPV